VRNTTAINRSGENSTLKIDIPRRNYDNGKGYSKYVFVIIGLTMSTLILGFLLRTWRIIREGMTIAFDGHHFQEIAKVIYVKNLLLDMQKI